VSIFQRESAYRAGINVRWIGHMQEQPIRTS